MIILVFYTKMASLIRFYDSNNHVISIKINSCDIGYDLIKWLNLHYCGGLYHMINVYRIYSRNKYSYKMILNPDCISNIFWKYDVMQTNKGIRIFATNYTNNCKIEGNVNQLLKFF